MHGGSLKLKLLAVWCGFVMLREAHRSKML